MSKGKIFRKTVAENAPVQIVGTINAYTALMAETIGHQAIYLSGGGVANASHGLPDLGMTSLNDVLEDASRIANSSNLPLLVDIDTGWGGAFNIALTIKKMERAGVAAVHIEDQISQKRCGHRPNKELVPTAEMVDRIKSAVDARSDGNFVIMARTDALSVEGFESSIERAMAYIEAGADMLFPEAMLELSHYEKFCQATQVPCLANITEFGQTPLFTKQELHSAGIQMVLYPLSAFRAMNRAAETVYKQLLTDGHQHNALESMQTREELYEYLNYHQYEQTLDKLNNQ